MAAAVSPRGGVRGGYGGIGGVLCGRSAALPVADAADAGGPATHVLLGATPNPWQTLTSIRFGLPAEGGVVRLRIHDVSGRQVLDITTPPLSPGYHQISWDGWDDAGQRVLPGVYFYTVQTNGWKESGRMLMVR